MDQNEKLRIIMYSSADKVAGQGVGSAYKEQVRLVEETCSDIFDVEVNNWFKKPDIQHFHTIDPIFLVKMMDKKAVNVAYCHFLPDTVIDGSLKIPSYLEGAVSEYIIHFYNQADHLVVVNPSFIDELVKYDIDRSKITYIPNYVSKEEFHPISPSEIKEYKKGLGIDENAFVVLGAGQVQTRKGVQDFVKVAKELPEITFVWAGGFSFGKMTDGYEELEEIMKNPPANVKFIGIVPREEMVKVYNMADILFIPSYNELFPMTILESSNIGVPLVIRDLELYEDILFNHYAKGHTNEDFVNLIKKMYEDPSFYEKYKQESLKISDFYSKENVAKLWREFYLNAYKQKMAAKKGE